MKQLMKRLAALLLVLCTLTGSIALADDDEELLIEDVILTTEGDEVPADETEEVFITDDVSDAAAEMDSEMELDTSINPDDLELNPNLPDHVINILLVGIDTRDTDLDSGLQHGDVQIILSLNTATGEVKMTSILRDLYLTIPGYKSKNRANVAYARGGGQLAMRMINHTFELNIQYYATINFYGLASIIDSLGGIDVDLSAAEAGAINSYLRKHPPKSYDNTDGSAREELEKVTGIHHLDGVQAVMYARVRSIDNDFSRTARQRHLLELLLSHIMQDMDMDKLLTLINTTLPYVSTNMTASEMLQLAVGLLQSGIVGRAQAGEELVQQMRIPMDDTWKYDKTEGGSSVVVFRTVARREENVKALHEFIYGEYYPAD